LPSNSRLEGATRITRVATASPQAGSINKAVMLAPDIEQTVPDAGRLLDATSFFSSFILSGE
jgi:hypothetical protein